MQRFSAHSSPAFRGACLLVIGILAGTGQEIPSLFLSVALVLPISICLFLLLSPWAKRLRGLVSALSALLWVWLGISVGASAFSFDTRPYEGFLDSTVLVRGSVRELSRKGNNGRLVLEAEVVFHRGHKYRFPYTILATVTAWPDREGSRSVRYGTVLVLGGILSRPTEERNPGEFSLRKYYEANGIDLVMLSRKREHFQVSDGRAGSWIMRAIVAPAREYLDQLFAALIGGEESELLKGIMIGERSGLSQSTRTAFTNAGVAHVLAVSGSNVAVVAAALFVALEFLRLSRKLQAVVTSIGVVFFMLLSGSQPAVVRATVMALVFLVGRLAQRKPNPYNSLGMAAIVLLMPNPRQLFDVGFQLSFVAVLSIVHLYPLANGLINTFSGRSIVRRALVWTLRICALSAVATLGTLPLTATYFGRVSIIGLAANIVVIPAVGASVILGMATAVAGLFAPWIAAPYASVNLLLLRMTLWFTHLAGGLPIATIDSYSFGTIDALPYYAGLLLLFHYRAGALVRMLTFLFLIALHVDLLWPGKGVGGEGGKARITFIDVGQGDAVLIELPSRRVILIDAGPRSQEFDAGERIIVPFLKRRGIAAIDLLLLSHPDADHIGGSASVIRELDVQRVVDNGLRIRSEVYEEYVDHRDAEGCIVLQGRAGQQLLPEEWEARLYVISPSDHQIACDTLLGEHSLNGTSVVVKFQYKKFSLLSVGDAGRETEPDLIRQYGAFLHSTLLKVGHHGSSSSSAPEFVNLVRPQCAVISVGRFNLFRHPSRHVLEVFRAANVEVARTDEEGAIIFETDGYTASRVDWR
jgi:competence protein ComEC